MPKRNLTTQQLAEVLDLDSTTIQKWVRAGLPCDASKGHRLPSYFNEGEVSKWMLENNYTGKPGRKYQPRSKEREKLEIRKLELAVAKLEREEQVAAQQLIDAAEEHARDVTNVTMIRNKLLGLGATLAPQLDGMGGAERQDLIDEAVDRILKSLSEETQ